jgi:intracellular septation protein
MSERKLTQGQKLLLDFAPLFIFFITNWQAGIFWGTGLFMVATAIALIAGYLLTGTIARMPLITAIFVAIFGGLTIWLHNDLFIKIKVTLINALFGTALLAGLRYDHIFLKAIMGEMVHMPREAWRRLTMRWGVFFLAVAALNEAVWRNVSTDMWVNFKVFGLMGLTLVFAFANAPFMAKYMEEPEAEKPSAD